MDGAPACPFVAFGDDRDARSTSPDHRHRCFAEIATGARERSPTRRRTASRARSRSARPSRTGPDAKPRRLGGGRVRGGCRCGRAAGLARGRRDRCRPRHGPGRRRRRRPADRRARRTRRRPEPAARLGRAAAVGDRRGTRVRDALDDRPDRQRARWPAVRSRARASPAAPPTSSPAAPHRRRRRCLVRSARGAASTAPHDELAGLVEGRPAGTAPRLAANGIGGRQRRTRPSRRRRPAPAGRQLDAGRRPVVSGPSWERPRRYEAYPAIKTRAEAARHAATRRSLAGALGDRCARAVHAARRCSASAAAAEREPEPEPARRDGERAPTAPPAPTPPSTSSSRATRCRRSPTVRGDARGAAGRQHGDDQEPGQDRGRRRDHHPAPQRRRVRPAASPAADPSAPRRGLAADARAHAASAGRC